MSTAKLRYEKNSVECQHCGHEQIETVREKTTSVCDKCRWPNDVDEDGFTVTSPLALCRGEVRVTDDRDQNVCTGFGDTRAVVLTVEKIVREQWGKQGRWMREAEKRQSPQ